MNQPSEEVRMMAAEVERLFCDNFSYYMKLKDRSQVDIAKALGVTELTVRNWELGNYRPAPERHRKIEDAYGISIHHIKI